MKFKLYTVFTIVLLAIITCPPCFGQASFPGYTLSNFINNVAKRPLSHPDADVTYITNNSAMTKGWANIDFIPNSTVSDTLLLTWNQGVLNGPGVDILIVCFNDSYSGKADVRFLLSDGTYTPIQFMDLTSNMVISTLGTISLEYYNCFALTTTTPTQTGLFIPAAKEVDIASFYNGPLAIMGVEFTHPILPNPDIITIALTQNAIVQNINAPVVHESTITGCNSVLFNGTNYTSSTILQDTVRNISNADSIYNIVNIVVTQIVPVTSNTTITGCNSVDFSGTTYTSSAIVTDTISSVQGCDSIYNVANIVITAIVPSVHNTTITGCNSINYAGTIYIASTVVTDTISSVQGCDSIYNVANIVITAIVPVVHSTTITGCNSVIFGGTTYTSSTAITDTISSVQGCDSIYNTTNIVISPIVPVVHSTTMTGCSSVIFGGTTYTASTTIADTIRNVQGCDSIYNITNIVIAPILPAAHHTTITGCNSVVFGGTIYTASTTVTDTIQSMQGCDSIYAVTNIIITAIVPIVNTTTITGCGTVLYNNITYSSSVQLLDTTRTSGGCDSIYQTVVIVVLPNNFNPVLTSSANNVDPGTPVLLSLLSSSNYTVLSWQPAAVFLVQDAHQQNILVDSAITITATVQSSDGCIGIAQLLLTVNKKLPDGIYFPSAFTPGDGILNNEFGPVGNLSLLKDFSFAVYNRWGMLVFSSNDPFKKWNGGYKGTGGDPGTFVWQSTYVYKGIPQRRKGYVVLLK